MPLSKPESSETAQVLNQAGLRPTRQRKVVYEVICSEKDHPSAEVVHERAKRRMDGISLATVYNCLESFVSSGLVRQLNFQRQSSRYCPVLKDNPHFAHFHCRRTGNVYDVVLSEKIRELIERELPEGLKAEQVEINVAGTTNETNELSPNTPVSKE
ncbi:Fur family transcriptional regulator [Puniceicoccus vermicola]|uniref:Transcriptional repressor n=1 Tax=Puniceicoccus vermicola TaxID=388746 RepID=A0A7X1AX02_9BACT|nr:transcriptional repressor [Puniceicoccus vermicola]MBC2601397.1 transcriptional repressor [Puniceicoccus vermicola]